MTNIQQIPVKALSLSRANARSSDKEKDIMALKADILAHGLLQNLVIIPQKKKGLYSVIAGGRRLRALQSLISDGVLPEDHAVPAHILDENADPQENSLAENFQRQAMNPADEAAAFGLLAEKGQLPADIAKRFGITERHVKQRLRLASLAPCVFEALRMGEINLDQAMAFTASPDPQEQATVFKAYRDQPWNMKPQTIRARMEESTLSSDDRLARLVSRDAYVAAGGRIDEDLFSGKEGPAEIWLDRHVAEELAQARLDAEAASIKNAHGYAWVRPLLSGKVSWQDSQDLYQVRGKLIPKSEADQARISALETEIEDLAARQDDDDWSEEDSTRYDALSDELEALQEEHYEVHDEDKATAGVFLLVHPNGSLHLDPRLWTEQPQRSKNVIGTSGLTSKDPDALSETLAGQLAKTRTGLLQQAIAADPAFAFDLAAFIGAERFARTSRFDTGGDLGTSLRYADSSRMDVESSDTFDPLASVLEALDTSWRGHKNISARFDAFRALGEDKRTGWFAALVAMSLMPSLNIAVGIRSVRFHDHLGQCLTLDAAALWRPTADTYFSKVSKTKLLAIAADIGGPAMASRYAGSKKSELAKALEALCAGQAIVDAEVRAKALAWIPPEMTFSAEALGEDDEALPSDEDGDDLEGDDTEDDYEFEDAA
jgi:ParB family chromosome partitioning protein